MKKILLFSLLTMLIACSQNPKNQQEMTKTTPTTTTTVKPNFDWLLGSWSRLNDKEGRKTYEQWEKISDTEYKGLGYTLSKGDTVFKENIRLTPLNGVWQFEVTGVNEVPTLFALTDQTKDSFVCENPQNEFPTKIEYALKGNRLTAKVTGGDMAIDFVFEKKVPQ